MNYKVSPNDVLLEDLFNTLNPIIESVLRRCSKSFSKKHADDFLDIEQNVKLDLFKVLPKLTAISISGNQIIGITVKGTIWAFRVHYNKYKKANSFVFKDLMIGHDVESDELSEDPLLQLPRESLPEQPQLSLLLLEAFKKDIIKNSLKENRYQEQSLMVQFIIESKLEGRIPSAILLESKWGVKNKIFWFRYTDVLLKLGIYNTLHK
jgi:hypothetical protein